MIVSIGEVVWDIFPDRQVLGGAPVNVAYHLQCLGNTVLPVSRIGRDSLGDATLAQLRRLGMRIAGIQLDSELKTGQVVVSVDQGEPHFDIVAPAAWDAMDARSWAHLIPDDFVLVYGTLAQRDARSRRAIRQLWPRARYRYYDVNLRPPYTTPALVEESLAAADLVKVNNSELLQLGEWFQLAAADEQDLAENCRRRFSLQVVVVTAGAQGAWVVDSTGVHVHPGCRTTVVDTVGAGDAFFAAVIHGLENHQSWPEILAAANRRGAYVAGQRGATPPMPAGI